MTLTRVQLALFSGRKPRSSSFAAAVTELTRRCLIRPTAADRSRFELTPAGHHTVGAVERQHSTEDVIVMWSNALPAYERSLFEEIVRGDVTKAELAERTGRSITSSSFAAAITNLKKNGLIEVDGGVLRLSGALTAGVR